MCDMSVHCYILLILVSLCLFSIAIICRVLNVCCVFCVFFVFFFQAEDGIRDLVRSRGLGDVYKRQGLCDTGATWQRDCEGTDSGGP